MNYAKSAMRMWLAGRNLSDIPIEDARSLGPKSAILLTRVGVKTLADLKELGWKKCYEKIVRKNPKSLNANLAVGIAAAELCLDWRALPEDLKNEVKDFHEKLKAAFKPAKYRRA